jgi:mannitol/fructose-specific phosphotransferase system IIA component (Ntr-type)
MLKLQELLRAPTIKVGLEARTKFEAIDELIDLLVERGELAPSERAAVARAVYERERLKSTGMENGVALPHGAVEGLEDVAAALGIAREGIDFGSADGGPATLVVLLAIPQNMLQFHVKTLAGIARLLNDDALRERLRAAKTPEEAAEIIRAGEGDGA